MRDWWLFALGVALLALALALMAAGHIAGRETLERLGVMLIMPALVVTWLGALVSSQSPQQTPAPLAGEVADHGRY